LFLILYFKEFVLSTSDFTFNTNNNNPYLSSSNQLEAIDYQLYGEAPPSYKLSKYYPKANFNIDGPEAPSLTTVEPLLNNESKEEDEKTSHIYENIDDASQNHQLVIKFKPRSNDNETNYSQAQMAANSKRKRSKFQGVKKNSSLNSSIKNKVGREQSNKPQPQQPQTLPISPTPSIMLSEVNLEQTRANKNYNNLASKLYSSSSSSSSNSTTSSSLNANNNIVKSSKRMEKNRSTNKSCSEEFL
jgi:hypothetical protein